jgi:hypothetical protein
MANAPTIPKIKPSLESLMTPSKTTEVDFPGYKDFKIKLTYLGRDELLKLRKKSTTTKFDRKTRQPVEEVDDDLFLQLYVGGVIKGWSGFKYKYLGDFLLVELEDVDGEDSMEYSEDNAYTLMKNSPDFDNFVAETVGDLQNFTKSS